MLGPSSQSERAIERMNGIHVGSIGVIIVMFSNLKGWNGILEGFIWNLNDPNGFVQLIL
jgi:hypothetical protein